MRCKTAGGNLQTHPTTLKYYNCQYQSVLALSLLLLLLSYCQVQLPTRYYWSIVSFSAKIGGFLSLQSILECDSIFCYIQSKTRTFIKVLIKVLFPYNILITIFFTGDKFQFAAPT